MRSIIQEVPIAPLHEAGEAMPVRKLFSSRIFWAFAPAHGFSGCGDEPVGLRFCGIRAAHFKKRWGSGWAMHVCNPDGAVPRILRKFSEKSTLTAFMAGSGALCIVSYLLTGRCAPNRSFPSWDADCAAFL